MSLPHPGGWALAEDSGRLLAALVAERKPQRILEFGSGYSTLLLSAELEKLGRGSIDTIDNSPLWRTRAEDDARSQGLSSRIRFATFPLGLRWYGGHPYVSYRVPAAFYPDEPYDLALIDAPHHDAGRDGPFYEAWSRLREGGLVFADDCGSPHMQATLARWKRRYPGALKAAVRADVGRGIGLIEKTGSRGPALVLADWPTDAARAVRNAARVRALRLNA